MSFPASSRVAALAAALFVVLALVPSARAGTYQVRACDASNVNRSWTAWGDTSLIAADASCVADSVRGMRVRNSLRAPGGAPVLAPMNAIGGLQAVATPGTVITGLHADTTSFDEPGSSNVAGWRAGIMVNGATASSVRCLFTLQACAWVGPPTQRTDLGFSASSVQLTVVCYLQAGCQRDRVRAATTLREVTLDVRDDQAPSLSVRGGALWGGGGWLQGSAGLSIRGDDNAGVRRLAVDAGALSAGASDLPCDDYAMKPCPGQADLDAVIDTARLPDGPNTVVARVTDAGGAATEQRSTIMVDNVAPTVAAPELHGSSDWRSANEFELGIGARDGDRGSGVQAVAWEVCRMDGSGCDTRSAVGSPSKIAVSAPGRGEWRVRAWAADALRSGPKSPWSAPLRFDDFAPGAPRVDAGTRWLNDDDASVVVDFPDTSPVGPSGISGFAIARGDAQPGQVVTDAGQKAVLRLADLPEGQTRIRARAISGAGVAGIQVAEGVVRIDRTAPHVDLRAGDAPLVAKDGEWLRQGVTLSAWAEDGSFTSGMGPAAADEPITRGGYLEYQVDDRAPVRVRGGSAQIDLPDDGLHAVTVRAVDVAGNISDPARATFRVDRNRPSGSIERLDSTQPRRLHATVAEECLESASLQLRMNGWREFRSFPAQVERRAVTGVIPDDVLAAGDYVARFEVRDCAGNLGYVYYGTAALPGTLRLPLRDTLVVDAGVTAGAAQSAGRATVRQGTPVLVRGQVRTLSGGWVTGRRVEVQERVGASDWRLRAVRVTDDTGRVSVTLRSGPSRQIRLVVADTEQTIGAASRPLAVSVPARVTVRADHAALRNGQAVRFRGALLGGFVPHGGRELELQGFNPLKGRWQPVRTQGLRTDGRGRWSTRYRFTATVGATVTYRFRVRVAPRPDHPFAEGFSRVVAVTVRG